MGGVPSHAILVYGFYTFVFKHRQMSSLCTQTGCDVSPKSPWLINTSIGGESRKEIQLKLSVPLRMTFHLGIKLLFPGKCK